MSIWNSVGHDVYAGNGAREQGSVGESDGFAIDIATSAYEDEIRLAFWSVDDEKRWTRTVNVSAVLDPEYAAKLRDNLTEALDLIGYVAPSKEA